ncbi:hypothetical protein S40288_08638 [Stachybotrys chartarum IBT 40288]|nr:hypothetical protein S40288_08638 [Stachybotrys chartarum IBT 40288]
MVYDWEAHHQLCHQLYIQEDKALEEVMDHLRRVHHFTASGRSGWRLHAWLTSKRAFQTQFRRWVFPSKQNPAYKNQDLVRRVHELWERNLPQREILRVLNEEDGFNIKARELVRVRQLNRWLLRSPNVGKLEALTDIVDSDNDSVVALRHGNTAPLDDSPPRRAQGNAPKAVSDAASGHADPAVQRKARGRRGNVTSDGPEVPARFPSEMTIDEARLILNLDQAVYRTMRADFQRICREQGVVKKTVAGPEHWEALKDRLIDGHSELQASLRPSSDNAEPKKLALEIICTDVTKRMRGTETRMTLAEAKRVLGVNPQEARTLRAEFQDVLGDASFTSKSDAGPEHWEELKRKWTASSDLVKRALGSDENADTAGRKAQALETLARDVTKRLRDQRMLARTKSSGARALSSKAAATAASQDGRALPDEINEMAEAPDTSHVGVGDEPAGHNFDNMPGVAPTPDMGFGQPDEAASSHLSAPLSPRSSTLTESPQDLAQPQRALSSSMPTAMPLDSQMGQPLLLAGNTQPGYMHEAFPQQLHGTTVPATPSYGQLQPVATSVAVYLRLDPTSGFVDGPAIWIATLNALSVQELTQAAAKGFPGVVCLRVAGVVRNGRGHELLLPIEQDAELGAYLTHVQGEAPTFIVQLWKS